MAINIKVVLQNKICISNDFGSHASKLKKLLKCKNKQHSNNLDFTTPS